MLGMFRIILGRKKVVLIKKRQAIQIIEWLAFNQHPLKFRNHLKVGTYYQWKLSYFPSLERFSGPVVLIHQILREENNQVTINPLILSSTNNLFHTI